MSYYPGFSQNLAYAGGLLATTTALVAETVSTDPAVGAGSFLLGGAGLIAAISAFTKDFWQDRQRQREHELARLRFRAQANRANEALDAVLTWIKEARLTVSALPAAPDIGHLRDHRDDD
ncbi:hypothetical protein [Paludisphaera mucosa]|uniref:Holin n=1 Tax=Paludisphaera mucosa TaxID=3030827 RepID=A0ABT6FD52_9BACT|nr:hypothetical protein [Paludisphaera mucosa]MDG3005512.1 hypothetical protein [Paludisphaera mucosa]